MSIPVQTPFNLYIANGSTTVFPYRFLLNQASDLRVTANGKVIASGFSVSGEGNPSGGQITFSRPPESGTKIAILRNIPLRRDTEYQDNGDLLAGTINADFDRLWMALQGVDATKDLALSRPGQDVDYYDAKGLPVKNVKDPVDPQDVATKNALDAAVTRMGQQVQDAKTHLDVVWQSVSQNAVAAKQSEDNAAVSEQQAAQHAQAAATETTSLLRNEFTSDVNRAETAATNAEASATNAKASAASAAKETADQLKILLDSDVSRAEAAATSAENSEAGAQQALEEAKLIAKTPGAEGKSAYEIWKEQQPAGSDTSMTAYLLYMKGGGGAFPAYGEVGSYVFGGIEVANTTAPSSFPELEGSLLKVTTLSISDDISYQESHDGHLSGTWRLQMAATDFTGGASSNILGLWQRVR